MCYASGMAKLIMIRHGESVWNKRNLFTGWVDIGLSKKGIEQSLEAGKKIRHMPIDVVLTSTLIRAQMTAMLAMSEHEGGRVLYIVHPENTKEGQWAHIYSPAAEEQCIPVYVSWHLNERMYGELQGMNKQEMREQFGEEQVQVWRRSFEGQPPEGESLAMTAKRTLPYFHEKIIPYLKAGKNVLVAAHGNSLRSIVMELDSLSKEAVVALEIPLGEPIVYEYASGKWLKST